MHTLMDAISNIDRNQSLMSAQLEGLAGISPSLDVKGFGLDKPGVDAATMLDASISSNFAAAAESMCALSDIQRAFGGNKAKMASGSSAEDGEKATGHEIIDAECIEVNGKEG